MGSPKITLVRRPYYSNTGRRATRHFNTPQEAYAWLREQAHTPVADARWNQPVTLRRIPLSHDSYESHRGGVTYLVINATQEQRDELLRLVQEGLAP